MAEYLAFDWKIFWETFKTCSEESCTTKEKYWQMKRSFIKFSKIEFPNVWFNFGTSWTKWNASQSLNRSFSKLFARCFWKRCSKYFSFEIIEKRWNNKYNLLQNNFTSWAIAPKFWNYFFFSLSSPFFSNLPIWAALAIFLHRMNGFVLKYYIKVLFSGNLSGFFPDYSG